MVLVPVYSHFHLRCVRCTSPSSRNRYLPHNFAVVFRGQSPATRTIMKEWWHQMHGAHGDDQKPLMKAIEAKNFNFTRLSEGFTFAFKSVDRGRYGMWPRFTYAQTVYPHYLRPTSDRYQNGHVH